MGKIESIKINDSGLGIGVMTLPVVQDENRVVQYVDYIYCCDVSGSMSHDLPKMRRQLKNRLADLMNPGDTVTIIAFSGRNECTVLQEYVDVKDMASLQRLHSVIDKFLVPVGLTCFLGPIQKSDELVDRLPADDNRLVQFIFMSDGYNNDCPWHDVVQALENLENQDSNFSSTIIEYGYYADSKALDQMAEILGGAKIVAEDFDSFVPSFERQFKNTKSFKRKVDISEIKGRLLNQFVFTYQNGEVAIISTERKSEILIPENVEKLFFITKNETSSEMIVDYNTIYLYPYALIQRGKFEEAEQVLGFIGDIKFIEQIQGAYGKQKINQLKEDLLAAVSDSSLRFTQGKDEHYKPKGSSYSIIELLSDLSKDEGCLVYPYHENFIYSRTGCKTVTKAILSKEERIKLFGAKTKREAEKLAKEITGSLATFEPKDKSQGYPITNLTFNETRANVSLQITVPGTVKFPANDLGLDIVEAVIIRNYTIVKDGILNMTELPIKVGGLRNKLEKLDLLTPIGDGIELLDFSQLPIITKRQTSKISANELAKLEVELLKMRFNRKVISYFIDTLPKPLSDRIAKGYTVDQINYMKSMGMRGGIFSPLTERIESGDFYLAPNLETKIEKFSAIPKVEDVLTKIAEGKKMTPSADLMKFYIEQCQSTIKNSSPKAAYDALNLIYDQLNAQIKHFIRTIAVNKFILIMSRKWFSDLKEDQNTVTVEIQGNSLNCVFEFTEKKVKL